jgi:hypothetical protein
VTRISDKIIFQYWYANKNGDDDKLYYGHFGFFRFDTDHIMLWSNLWKGLLN